MQYRASYNFIPLVSTMSVLWLCIIELQTRIRSSTAMSTLRSEHISMFTFFFTNIQASEWNVIIYILLILRSRMYDQKSTYACNFAILWLSDWQAHYFGLNCRFNRSPNQSHNHFQSRKQFADCQGTHAGQLGTQGTVSSLWTSSSRDVSLITE